MKKLLIIAGCMVAASAVLAQGTLNFANGAAGVNAPIKNSLGVAITGGNNYVADLFWVTTTAGAIAPESSLAAAGFNSAFNINGAPVGYFFGGAQSLPNTGAGTIISAEVRVWNTVIGGTSGQSYASANSTPGGEWGKSIEFNVTLTANPTPPGNLTGLGNNGFTLTLNPVPEPSTFALAGLGAAALLIFRRRK